MAQKQHRMSLKYLQPFLTRELIPRIFRRGPLFFSDFYFRFIIAGLSTNELSTCFPVLRKFKIPNILLFFPLCFWKRFFGKMSLGLAILEPLAQFFSQLLSSQY